MTRTALLRPTARTLLVVGCTLAVLTPSLPAFATSTPSISSVSPAVTHVGRTVTVAGSGLEDTTGVSIAGTPADGATVVAKPDGLSLTFAVPAGATLGSDTVTITTASGGSSTSPGTVQVAPAPAAVTGLTAGLGLHGLALHWTGRGTGTTLVRALAGSTAPASPTAGAPVTLTGLAAAYDPAFTNTSTRSYAVYAVDKDGTTSDTPAILSQAPLPALGTTLTLAVTPTTVQSGQLSTVTGRLIRTASGLPLAGAKVDVLRRVAGSSTLTYLRILTSDANGVVRTTVTDPRTSAYALRYRGDAFSARRISASRVVQVQPRLTASFSSPIVALGQSSTLHGAVTPVYAGAVVVVQRAVSGTWRGVRSVRTTSAGTWSASLSPALGTSIYRALLPAEVTHLQAISPHRVIQVAPRTLVSGSRGSDVLALEHALAQLHYFVGAQDGVFDYNLQHAVIAFEKVERLSRNATWGNAERTRLLAPRGIRLRYPSGGKAVVVDITRQVLVLSQGGQIVKIVDVSTGSENHYTQDGVDNIAHTPRGRFQITHKIDGIRISKLGELYRPSYFFQGYAVHGNGSVPTYNASHGCIRVTNPVADYLFPLLTVGTPLAVYDE